MNEILTVEAVLGLTALIAPMVIGLYLFIQFRNNRPNQFTNKDLKDLESQVE